MLPVHPHPEPDRLLGDLVGKALSTRLAELDEAVDPVGLDVALVLEAEILFGFDLDPQPLAVEAVLVALPLAEHGVVALVEVLVGAAPGVMHPHRVIGGDRAVEEAETTLRARVARQVPLLRPLGAPELSHLALEGRDVQLA